MTMERKLPKAGPQCIPLDQFKPTGSPGKAFARGDLRRAKREEGTMKFQLKNS
jgi:hypothetical protein